MTVRTADEDFARLLLETDFCDEQNVKELKLEPPTYQQLRLEFTRKPKKVLAGGGDTRNTRRKRRKRGKSGGANSREENKENVAAPPKASDESFLQEWHDDEVEIADYRSSDDSQDEQLEEWYKDLKSNKARDTNISPAKVDAQKVGPVIRHKASDEEKSWLQTDIADTYLLDLIAMNPDADNAGQIVFDDLMDPCRWIEKTHLMAEETMLVRNNRIFTILRQNRPRNLLAHLRLGYCVTNVPGRPECQQKGQKCALRCNLCEVCCHMYSCTCRLIKRFQWCSHIHAAVLCGGNQFKHDQQVYVHIGARYTQLSHLRATCYDMANDVKPVEIAENVYSVMGWATEWVPYSVVCSPQKDICHLCPQYKRCPECSICRHQCLCACAEFMVKKRLCEHCHVVAIFLSENRVNFVKKREFRYLSDVSDDTDEEADPDRDNSPVLLPLRKLVARHEKSYSVPLKRIQAGSVNNQPVYFVQRCDPDRRFLVHTQNMAHCTCSQDSATQDLKCIDCRMCRHTLTCNCGKGDTEFCKHRHAVRRYIIRCSSPGNGTVESALRSVLKGALNNFQSASDAVEVDSALTAEEDIVGVVEQLKLVMGSDFEVELQNVDEQNISENGLDEDGLNNFKLLENVDQGFDPPCEVNIIVGADSCAAPLLNKSSSNDSDSNVAADINESYLLSSNSEERNACSLNSVSENSNEDLTAGESVSVADNSDEVEQLQSVQKAELISASDSETNLVAENESLAEIQQCNDLNSAIVEPTPDGSVDDEQSAEEVGELAEAGDAVIADVSCDLVAENESSAEIQQCNHLCSTIVKPTPNGSVDDEQSAEEVGKSTEADGSVIVDLSCDSQLSLVLKNSNDGVDTSASVDEASAGVESGSFLDANAPDTPCNLVLQKNGSQQSGVCEEFGKEVLTPFDFSKVKTFRRYYDFKFEPVMEIHYKSNADIDKDLSEIFAETSRCVVTVRHSLKKVSLQERVVLPTSFSQTARGDENTISRDTGDFSLVSKNHQLCGVEESVPHLNLVLPHDPLNWVSPGDPLNRISTDDPLNWVLPGDPLNQVLPDLSRGFSLEEADENRVSSETCGSSLAKCNGIRSVVDSEPVLLENSLFGSGVERADQKQFLPEACAPSVVDQAARQNGVNLSISEAESVLDFENSCGGFDTEKEDSCEGFEAEKEDGNLVLKDGSESTRFGAALKQKGLNWLQKLNLGKFYKKHQKEETSFSRFFSGISWSRSRQQSDMAVLQSVADEFSDTDVSYVTLGER